MNEKFLKFESVIKYLKNNEINFEFKDYHMKNKYISNELKIYFYLNKNSNSYKWFDNLILTINNKKISIDGPLISERNIYSDGLEQQTINFITYTYLTQNFFLPICINNDTFSQIYIDEIIDILKTNIDIYLKANNEYNHVILEIFKDNIDDSKVAKKNKI